MTTTIVRYQTRPECTAENQALVEQVFAELARVPPKGLRYTSYLLADQVTFVHVAEVDTADGTNPLSETPAFATFVRDIASRCVEPPVATPATVVGSYGLD